MVEKLTCVPELKLERGENVNYLGDELPEGAANSVEKHSDQKNRRKTNTTKHRERHNQTQGKPTVSKNTAIRKSTKDKHNQTQGKSKLTDSNKIDY